MRITMKLFAFQAEVAGREVPLDLADGASVAAAFDALKQQFPAMRWAAGTLAAVNAEFAPLDRELRAGDIVAVIPPVSGG